MPRGYNVHSDSLEVNDVQGSDAAPASLSEGVAFQTPSRLLELSSISQGALGQRNDNAAERQAWQAPEPVQLKGHEHDMYQRFVCGVSSWIDLFDPLKHFSTFVPHLALYNVGVMKAVLALGARHLSIKPLNSGEVNIDRTAAVQ